MFNKETIGLLLVMLPSMCIAQARLGEEVIVRAQQGTYRGRQFFLENRPVNGFFGIRYAEAPVGSLRWKKPIPAEISNITQDALNSAPVCPQEEKFQGNLTGDEDCLFLDITVGGVGTTDLIPVVVYVNNVNQYQSGRSHTGALLSKRENLAVVIVYSRLGALGYFYDGPGTGNMALWDNLLALKWIQNNIESFGGDPAKVTLMGLDSGATTVQLLAATPQSEGLFHQIIAMSPLNLYAPRVHTPMEDKQILKSLAECDAERSVTCDVEGVSAEDVVRNLNNSKPNLMDKELFPNGFNFTGLQKYNYLTGVASAEENLLTSLLIQSKTGMTNGTITQDVMDSIIKSMCDNSFKDVGSRCLCFNGISTTFQVDKYAPYPLKDVQEILSSLYHSNFVDVLTDHSRQEESSTYAYVVDVTEDSELLGLPSGTTGSDRSIMTKLIFGYPFLAYGDKFKFLNEEFHNNELLSGASPLVAFGGKVELRSQSQDVMRYWANFIKFGNPSRKIKVDLDWPSYGFYSRAFLTIDNTAELKIKSFFGQQRYYEYFNDFYFESMRCIKNHNDE